MGDSWGKVIDRCWLSIGYYGVWHLPVVEEWSKLGVLAASRGRAIGEERRGRGGGWLTMLGPSYSCVVRSGRSRSCAIMLSYLYLRAFPQSDAIGRIK